MSPPYPPRVSDLISRCGTRLSPLHTRVSLQAGSRLEIINVTSSSDGIQGLKAIALRLRFFWRMSRIYGVKRTKLKVMIKHDLYNIYL